MHNYTRSKKKTKQWLEHHIGKKNKEFNKKLYLCFLGWHRNFLQEKYGPKLDIVSFTNIYNQTKENVFLGSLGILQMK